MRRSFRLKLYLVMSALIMFFVVMSIFLNNAFMEKYYILKKENYLKDTFKVLNTMYNEKGDVELEFEKLERMRGVHVVVADKSYSIVYDSMNSSRDNMNRNMKPPASENSNENNENFIKSRADKLIKTNVILENRIDRRLKTSFISLTGKADNGNYILLTLPVASIQDSAKVANRFFLIVGVFTLLMGFTLLYFITKKLTNPIVELNHIAQKMSSLDFSQRYMGKSKDEIGELGGSINTLSEKLEITINELVEANNKLQSDIENERRIDTMRKEFISNVSHELKTPIALVQGYAEGLMININDDEESKNFYCEVIMDEARKMNRLVKELLELSILESGQEELELSTFEILPLIKLVVKKNMLLLKEKGIVPEVTVPEGIKINADYDKIERVVVNFLTNAINHVNEKGIIKLGSKLYENKARISVFNSGLHISDEDIDKIWTSFYKADKARTREYGGTGLGLSIVKAIFERHGYKYGVENLEGGVEFWFEAEVIQ